MKRNKRPYLPLILAAVVFAVGGVDGLQHQAPLVGVTNLAAALLNVAALGMVKRRPRLTSVIVSLMNAVVAGAMCIAAVQAGKDYIQYAWALALLFFVAYASVLLWAPGVIPGADRDSNPDDLVGGR